MKAVVFFIFLFHTALTFQLFGQSSIVPDQNDFARLSQILPPAPNAASLGKYGGINAGQASGAINVAIPLFNYTANNITIPVSLNYNSTGFKVDEMPSRVGSGFSFEVGGVITRTVYGSVDENTRRVDHPDPWSNKALYEFMKELADYDFAFSGVGPHGSVDAQPDVFNFNFNGYTGQFILEPVQVANQIVWKPLLLDHSNLIVERNTSSADFTFKITTGDGTQYFFGSTSSTEYTTSAPAADATRCGNYYDTEVPTSWYVSKIVHPNQDIVLFSYNPIIFEYDAGRSQSIGVFRGEPWGSCADVNVPAPPIYNTSCITRLKSSGVILDEINSVSGGKVTFRYVNRQDCNDKLLSAIELFQPLHTNPYKRFELEYVHAATRPFLAGIKEKGSDNNIVKAHSLEYNDLESLPARLSFAQDHWGYFNGKTSNSTLIPVPTDPLFRQVLPLATANREANPAYASKGLLISILYPTGGKDSIVYEGNQHYTYTTTYPSPTSVSAEVTNGQNTSAQTVFSEQMQITYPQYVLYAASCSGGVDADISSLQIRVVDVNNNNAPVAGPEGLVAYNQSTSSGFVLNPGTYKIQMIVYGHGTSGKASIEYSPGTPVTGWVTLPTGGVRVEKITTSDTMASTPSIKKYFYHALLTPAISSGARQLVPVYEKLDTRYVACENGGCPGVIEFQNYYMMYSNSVYDLIQFGTPVTYSSVIESSGENFENGGIEHGYTVSGDDPPGIVNGTAIFNAPYTKNSWKNGKEIYQHFFAKTADGYRSVKKVFTHYKEDQRESRYIPAYVANKKYNIYCGDPAVPIVSYELAAYDLVTYGINRRWYYVDEVRTLMYDNMGLNYMEQIVSTEYENPVHAMPTKLSTLESNGDLTVVLNFYPIDLSLSAEEEAGRLALLSKNMQSTIMKQQAFRNNVLTIDKKTVYKEFENGLVLPESQWLQLGSSNPMEKRISFNKYNHYGKVLEQSKINDLKMAYLWDYQSMYAIAEVTNGSSSDVAYTSFEADGDGNWSFTPHTNATASVTGLMSHDIASGVVKNELNPSTAYKLSYWYKGGSVSLSVAPEEGSVKTYSNSAGWVYWEGMISGVTSVTLSGSGLIDELRLHPKEASMTTYTYDPLIGATTITDRNGISSYYVYDSSGRLTLLRDAKGNVIKTYEYNYRNH